MIKICMSTTSRTVSKVFGNTFKTVTHLNVFFFRGYFGMTDSCNQEHERNSDVSTSDDDSISLLYDPYACQSTGAAEDMKITDLASQHGNKEQKKTRVEIEINGLKPLQTDPQIACADSASQPGNSKSKTPEMSCEI